MIKAVLTASAQGAFFYDDQRAIRLGAKSQGLLYAGTPVTPGFDAIRMPARALSVGLVLASGEIAWGDMMSVQYAAAGSREPVFDPEAAIAMLLSGPLQERFMTLGLTDLRGDIAHVLAPVDDTPISFAMQYGLSQAIVRAHAQNSRRTAAGALTHAYGLDLQPHSVPIYAQSGDQREDNVQKMVLKRVDVLPHGLINNSEKFGPQGETFKRFVSWVVQQILELGSADYRPTLHFDLYGSAGFAFDLDVERIADYLVEVEALARPLALNIEAPADFGSKAAQIEGFRAIRSALNRKGSAVQIVVDEWCDTVEDVALFSREQAADLIQIKTPDMGSVTQSLEAILLCQQHGVGAYLGGSCVETDLSARMSVHVAVAGKAQMILAKPGMGVDEGLSIVGNELSRLLTQIRYSQQ